MSGTVISLCDNFRSATPLGFARAVFAANATQEKAA